MTVEHVELLVEEPSMEVALRALLPKIIGDLSFEVYRHQCKDELLERLPQRLRGYANWLPPSWRIVVIVDRDDDDCVALKANLEEAAKEAGLPTRSEDAEQWQVVNRLAIEELEAWYFGDWQAVQVAYPRVSPTVPLQARYRNPDAIRGGTWEAFERVLQRAGYFGGGLRKIEAARTVAALMDPAINVSGSFRIFRSTLTELAQAD